MANARGKTERADVAQVGPGTNVLDSAQKALWRSGLEGPQKGRRIVADPAQVLIKELGRSEDDADRVIESLSVSSILRHKKSVGWIITGESNSEDEGVDPEFLKLRDFYSGRDTSDSPVDEFVGVSAAVQKTKARIILSARHDGLVLITGESGSGKGVAAKLIHKLSSRKDKPFVHLNCAALPEGVLESELFGHERGSFTNAVNAHRGCFERAAGGTLFLDEIGEISPAFQNKLLQVLEEGIFFRVGGEDELRSDARIIVATNKNLAQAVKDRMFRRDLFFRIYGFPIHVAPLRERREDIPQLIAHCAAEISKRHSKSYRLTPEAFKRLSDTHTYPGNVRELQTVMSTAQILAEFELIDESHIEFPSLEMLAE